jgi:glutaredoxin
MPSAPVIFYWRPGCGFCATLRRRLRRAGVATKEVNIWDDRTAAAFVRSVARGNETVPTVVVGRRALVNPTVGDVLEVIRIENPGALPDPDASAATPRRLLRWRRRGGQSDPCR